MDSINEIIAEVQDISNKLNRLNIKQISADLAYFVAWWNSSTTYKSHLPPHPAGYDTVDLNSNNCPIPYLRIITIVAGNSLIKHKLMSLLLLAYKSFTSLKNLTSDQIELKAIESYLSYIEITIIKNGGTVPDKDDNEDNDNKDPEQSPSEPDETITDTVTLSLYLRSDDTLSPITAHFGENGYWFSIIKDQKDANKLSLLNHPTVNSKDIGFGCLKYSPNEFSYEIVGIYDEDGNHVDDYGNVPDNLYISQNADTVLTICNKNTPINSLCYTWGLKVSKKTTLILWTTIKGNVNATVNDQSAWALFESDGSGSQHAWGNNEYEIIDYAYYPGGSNKLSWQGDVVANNYWQLIKDSNGNIRVKGNDGVSNTIAAIKLLINKLPDPEEPSNPDSEQPNTITTGWLSANDITVQDITNVGLFNGLYSYPTSFKVDLPITDYINQ